MAIDTWLGTIDQAVATQSQQPGEEQLQAQSLSYASLYTSALTNRKVKIAGQNGQAGYSQTIRHVEDLMSPGLSAEIFSHVVEEIVSAIFSCLRTADPLIMSCSCR